MLHATIHEARAGGLRGRLVAIYAILVGLNVGAWLWAFACFAHAPDLLGIALVVYGLGLRHAIDADHIAAIDNVTRKLMQQRQTPVAVGFFFALGHSAVVILATAAVALVAGTVDHFKIAQDVGGLIGTGVSALFLFAIAAMNIQIFASVYRTYRRARRGDAFSEEDLDLILANRGWLARLFRPLFGLVSRSRHMLLLGFLFGLGFDTATEVAMFSISAAQAAKGLSLAAILVFPVLFAAGMALADTTDGVVMLGAYNWAVVKPMRKLRYNMIVTLISIVAALGVGSLEVLGLVKDQLALGGGFWEQVGALDDRFQLVGVAIILLFTIVWAAAVVFSKWTASLNRNEKGSRYKRKPFGHARRNGSGLLPIRQQYAGQRPSA